MYLRCFDDYVHATHPLGCGLLVKSSAEMGRRKRVLMESEGQVCETGLKTLIMTLLPYIVSLHVVHTCMHAFINVTLSGVLSLILYVDSQFSVCTMSCLLLKRMEIRVYSCIHILAVGTNGVGSENATSIIKDVSCAGMNACVHAQNVSLYSEYVWIYIYMYACMHAYMHTHIYTHIYAHIYMQTLIRIQVYCINRLLQCREREVEAVAMYRLPRMCRL
jgi:hypothetical protein